MIAEPPPVIEEAPVQAPKTVQDVLRHAAFYIEEHGWGQGRYRESDGRVCAMGALAQVVYRIHGSPDGLYGAAEVHLLRYLMETGRAKGTLGVEGWNDHAPNQTAANVVAVMREAADQLT